MGKSLISRSKKLLWVSIEGAMEIVMVPYNRKRTAKGSEKYSFQNRRPNHLSSASVWPASFLITLYRSASIIAVLVLLINATKSL